MLKQLREQWEFLEAEIRRYDEQIAQMSAHEEALKRLITIDLIETRSAENLLAEIGTEISYFANADNMVSWVSLCPGSHE